MRTKPIQTSNPVALKMKMPILWVPSAAAAQPAAARVAAQGARDDWA